MPFTEEEIREFQVEAGDLLDTAEKCLLALDKGEAFSSHYDSIFRTFHSIKGAAGMMDMAELQRHVHQLENILMERKSDARLSKPYIELFLRGADAARSLLRGESVAFDYRIGEARESKTVIAETVTPKRVTPRDASGLGKLIVVDDEPELLQIMSQVLKGAGFEVHPVSDPFQVSDLVATIHPDAVLTDIAMPGLTGMELLAKLKGIDPDLPVILVSGHITKDRLLEAIDNGVFSVIEKPFEVNRLIACALGAVQTRKLFKLLNRSVNLIMYQFPELDAFLKASGKDDIRTAIGVELNALLDQRRSMRSLRKLAMKAKAS